MNWQFRAHIGGASHVCLCGLLVVLSGCSSPNFGDAGPRVAGAMYRDVQFEAEGPEPSKLQSHDAKLPFQTSLTLREAVRRTLQFNPALKAAAFEIEAKHGVAVQASYRPNPDLGLETENFGGTGDFGGAGAAEETLSLSQVIELGGKRAKRIAVAELDGAVAAWEYESIRLRAIRETAEAFIDVLAIQETISRAKRATRIARDLERIVKTRVDAGELNPIEVARTRPMVARTLARFQSERARLEPARRRVASYWGQSAAGFDRVGGQFSSRTRFPPIRTIIAELDASPDVVRWSEEIARRQAVVDLEMAKAIPDLTLGAGIRRINETNDTAIVASASMNLPIFDRNGGNIAAADARLAKGRHERDATRAVLRTTLLAAYEELASAAAEVRALADQVVPSASAAFQATQSSFQAGAIELTPVLDARRVLFEAELDLVRAQAKFEKAKVRIEGLVGRIT